MCIFGSNVPDPIEYQKSESPDYRDPETVMSGRRGTILAGTGGQGDTPMRRRNTVLSGRGDAPGMMSSVSLPSKRARLGA